MDGLLKTTEKKEVEEEFSFYSYFVPFTTKKAIICIIIIVVIVYFNMLFNGFVWDDSQYIILNTKLHTFNFSNIFGQSLFNTGGQYRPIPALYFYFLYTLFQNSAFFYHLTSLAIHITNAILIFFLLKRT